MSHKDRNIAIAKKWFIDMWSRGDVDLARQIVHPDYNPDWIHIPKKGPDQVIHEMKYFRSIFPDLEYEILDSTSDESKAWVRYRGNGTHKGVAWGFSPTQKKVSFEGMGILEINKEDTPLGPPIHLSHKALQSPTFFRLIVNLYR